MTGDPERVEQVLTMAADVGLRDGDGRTALDIAVEWGLVAIAERLRAAGVRSGALPLRDKPLGNRYNPFAT